jgi:hypothetical protein
MSKLPVLPLLSYQADWEAKWDSADARFKQLKARVAEDGFGILPEHERARLLGDYQRVGASLGRIFGSQFRTTDDYRDWRLHWFDIRLQWKPEAGFEMPSGLPVREIRRRLSEAEASRLSVSEESPSFTNRTRIHEVLSAAPCREIENLAYALQRLGGDRV